ncbi:nuclear transport factor 2 family protein [Paraflavitalea sp. CAU 1676]|uniref:nuclear transport factor 2 family protein n=1 Tax=Paraflavitalea sp. CAU 1676 TaxID=3032598 RepID=UPI0023DA2892|nr:nuclear transport factor 2 family protein [Paraflavitalea sp. CAU 1676]MDF2190321.1 nuclear transport factor 2 family protein [Paraflavitalea sp. CAU 1676]
MQNGIQYIADFFPYYQTAAFEKDIPGMIGLYDENVVTFDMWGKGVSVGLTEWAAVITDWLTSLNEERVKVMFEMIDIQEGESIGFACAIIQFQAIGIDDRVLRSMRNRITIGLVKLDGYWKVKHQLLQHQSTLTCRLYWIFKIPPNTPAASLKLPPTLDQPHCS